MKLRELIYNSKDNNRTHKDPYAFSPRTAQNAKCRIIKIQPIGLISTGIGCNGCLEGPPYRLLGEAEPGGGSKRGGFPLFSGKVRIVSRILSGLFLVGAVK